MNHFVLQEDRLDYLLQAFKEDPEQYNAIMSKVIVEITNIISRASWSSA